MRDICDLQVPDATMAVAGCVGLHETRISAAMRAGGRIGRGDEAAEREVKCAAFAETVA